MDFEMPKPGPEHAYLARLAGRWSGEEVMAPSPWDPGGSNRTSTCEATMLEGFFLVTNYEQRDESGETVTFRGHGVYSWDPGEGCYVMYWFDSMGGPGGIAHGKAEGDVLTFQNSSPMGQHRYRYTFEEGGYLFEMAMSQDGEQWQTLLKGSYRPA